MTGGLWTVGIYVNTTVIIALQIWALINLSLRASKVLVGVSIASHVISMIFFACYFPDQKTKVLLGAGILFNVLAFAMTTSVIGDESSTSDGILSASVGFHSLLWIWTHTSPKAKPTVGASF